MKKIRTALITVGILFVLMGYSVYSSPVSAAAPKPTKTPKPTPTLTQQQAAIRLARGQTTALGQVARREQTLKTMVNTLNRRKGAIFETDFTEIMAMLTGMQAQFPQWRADINATTTIDALKSTQLSWIRKTRVYVEFQIKFRMLVKIGVFNKSAAQIAKRLDNLTKRFGNKYNNDKNKRYENVSAKLDEASAALAGITDLINSTKAKIQALTPDQYNTNPADFNKSLQDIRGNLNAINNKISRTFALLTQVSGMLSNIRNVTPTPTP